MASGASHADVAVMLVDARQGVKPQTRRHAAILDLVGVRHVILAVNKMDLVGWDETWYRAIEADFAALAQTFAFSGARAIPISARLGDNVAWRSRRMAWYAGPSLVERLDTVPPRLDAADSTFRLPVQMALRAGDFRGLAGTLAAGRIRVGETVADALTGRIARVERIVTMAGDLDEAVSGAAVVLELDADLDISRGAVLEARLVWLADAPWQRQQRLLLRTSTDLVPVEGLTVTSRLDLETLQQAPGTGCDTNDIVAAELRLARPAALDAFDAHPSTGSIALVDALTGATVAGGVVGAIRSGRPAAGRPRYRLTREMLAAELCKGLGPHDPEFQRRARAAAALIEEAGIAVTIEGLD
jgi:bifunctional enzyme CysN/CysC